MKASKFLIAENPIINDGRVFIIHLRDPIIIAEVFHFYLDQEKEWMKCKSQFSTAASVDYPGELIVLGSVFNAPMPDDWTSAQDNLAKIMRRMGDWYYNYLKWEIK